MSNNNLNHISDLSKYKIFDPTGTSWPASVTDVQTALSDIGSWALKVNGLPVSSTSTSGIIKLATQDLITAGTDSTTAVTPALLKVALSKPSATTTVAGISRYATDAEALAGTVTNASIVPETLKYVMNNLASTETVSGTIKLATQSQANAGTDNTTAVTPAKVKSMIAKFSPTQISYQAASNTVLGVTYIATSQQVAAGSLDTGYAISPKALMSTTASNTQMGVIRTATQAETIAGSSSTIAVTPSGLASLTGNTDRAGLLKLSSGPTGDTSLAAQASNTVFTSRSINGHSLSGDVNLGVGDIGTYSTGDIDNKINNAENNLNNTINNVQNSLINNPINLGDLYSIAFLANRSGTQINPGDTIDGSNLSYAGIGADWSTTGATHDRATVAVSWGPEGTWKCLGFCPAKWSDGGYASLFIRIS